MKDWTFIDRHYRELLRDVYDQPEDTGHSKLAKDVIDVWLPTIEVKTVLDVGCGTGFCYEYFLPYGCDYMGVAIDVERKKPLVLNTDFNFTPFDKNSFDLIFSRHSLEHSPFPLLTLMEWHRIAKKYLILILPDPEYYTYIGRNHYGVMPAQQARWILRRSGWKMIDYDYSNKTELRFLCVKEPRLSFEGYIEKLDNETYELDRDGK